MWYLFIENLPLNLNNSMRRAKTFLSAMPMGVRYTDVPLGPCQRLSDRRKRIKIPLTIYSDFKQAFFVMFCLKRGAILTLNYRTSDIFWPTVEYHLYPLFKVRLPGVEVKWPWMGTGRKVQGLRGNCHPRAFEKALI